MLIVHSFEKTSSVRSALGFMSLTSRWGAVLFPGITVLTRDLHVIKAMHDLWVYRCKRPNHNYRDELIIFKSRYNDKAVAKRIADLKRESSYEKYIQLMSYWQRYGSILKYFHMFEAFKLLALPQHCRLVFNRKYEYCVGSDRPWEADLKKRALRIKHATWFRNNSNKFSFSITIENLAQTLANPYCRWWLTGLEPPSGVPSLITAVRRLEFALVIWQTVFEAASLLCRVPRKIPKDRGTMRDPVKVFIGSILRYKADPKDWDALEDIVVASLKLHESIVSKCVNNSWLEKTYKEVNKVYNSRYSARHLFSCHNGKTLIDLANLPSKNLLQALAEVHVYYCEHQRKPNSIYTRSFNPIKLGEKSIFTLSTEYSGSRWGLFGYRFGASLGLYYSLSRGE